MKYLFLVLGIIFYSSGIRAQNTLVIRTSDGKGYDSHTWNTSSSQNFGTSPIIAVRAWTQSGNPQLSRAYFYFDLGNLPSKAVIDKAEFIITADPYDSRTQDAKNPDSILVQRVTSSWTESGITWSNAPSATNSGYTSIMQDTSKYPTYTFKVTDIVKYWQANSSSNYGLRVLFKKESPYTLFYVASKENSTTSARPRLEISYHYKNDLKVISIYRPFEKSCKDTFAGKIGVVVQNAGDNSVSGIYIKADLLKPYTKTFSSYYSGTLGIGKKDTIFFNDTLNLQFEDIYSITAYSQYSSDENLSNDTASASFYNYPFPVFNIGGPDTVCLGYSSYKVRKETNNTYSWSVKGGTIKSGQGTDSISVLWTNTGADTVALTIYNPKGCNSSKSRQVIVPEPSARFSMSSKLACINGSIDFTDLSTAKFDSITSWFWTFGDGSNCACYNPTHVYSKAGKYKVSLTVTTSRGCSHSTFDSVTIAGNPVVKIIGSDSICNGRGTYSVTSATGDSFYWNISGGNIASGQGTNSVVVNWKGGPARITAEVTNFAGCKTTDTRSITVWDVLKAGFNKSADLLCPGDRLTLTDISNTVDTIISRKWKLGDGRSDSTNMVVAEYNKPGIYHITLEVMNSHGCVSTFEDSVWVNQKPIAAFTADSVCAGKPMQFINSSTGPGLKYNWIFGTGTKDTSSAKNPTWNYSTPGSYEVRLVVTNASGCKDTTIQTVKVFPGPSVNISKNITVRTVKFNVSDTTMASYSWDFGDQSNSAVMNPTHTYSSDGKYIVQLTVVNANGCTSVATDTVEIKGNGITEKAAKYFNFKVYPNPFSDEVSVAYTLAKPASVKMSIYDLSGRIISEESAYMQSGNHTKRLSDQKLAPGTYILNFQIDDQSIQKQIFKLK